MAATSWMERCLAGDSAPDDIDDFIDVWHEGGTGMPLQEFLGLTRAEYAEWAEQKSSAREIVDRRRVSQE
jgi:hypothetical protein